MNLVLGLLGAFIGMPFGSVFAQIGWFIGSTIGSLLDIEDSHTSTQGPRITDFKTLNSKYGLAIPKVYGCSRLAGNMIFAGPIFEISESETTCEKTGGLFGTSLGEKTVCSTLTTFHYFQSACIAFAEGPAAGFQRVWADGKLVYDVSPTNTGAVTIIDQNLELNPFAGQFSSPFTFYTGTATQGIDANIETFLNAGKTVSGQDERTAFRHVVYMAINSLNLEPFGYRMPVFNAEICFDSATVPVVSNIVIPAPAVGGGALTSIGQSLGNPALILGLGGGSQTIYDTESMQYIAQTAGGSGWPIYVATDSDFRGIRTYSGSIVGPTRFDVSDPTEAYSYFINLSTNATINADYGGALNYSVFDTTQDRICVAYDGGGMGCWPMVDTGVPTFGGGIIGSIAGKNVWEADIAFYHHYSNGGGTNGSSREIFMDPGGNIWWLVSGAGGVWINKVAPSRFQTHWRLRFDGGGNVGAVSNWTYIPGADAFLIAVSSAPAGIYKLTIAALDAGAATNLVDLPPTTAPESYNPATPDDVFAFQQGIFSNEICFVDGADIRCVNASSLTDEVITAPPGGVGSGLQYVPLLDGYQANDRSIVISRFAGVGESLDVVVADLMTKVEGEDRPTLTVADIDVSDLAVETVRGYPLLQQTTVRAAITPLQQAYFFDAVESDGLIKFVKRGQSVLFNIPEDDLAAHEFGKTSSQTLVPVEFERQSEVELPREVAVNYTGLEEDYSQSTQRARREQTDADTNMLLTLPITFNADEAAKIADILLSNAWTERTAPFKMKTGPFYLDKDATDVFTVTMNDGTIHVLRIVDFSIGVNGMCEITAVNEFTSLYSSEAVGTTPELPPQVIPLNQIQVFLADVPASFLGVLNTGNQGGVVVGLGVFGTPGSNFPGGTVSTSTGTGQGGLGGGSQDPVSFGVLDGGFGFPNGPSDSDQFDYETVITGTLLGGPLPTSNTETEALSGGQEVLVIIGNEIIAFTNISFVNNTFTLSGGLLRGLYGTENSQYHPAGEQILFAENLFFAPNTSGGNTVLTGTALPSSGGNSSTASTTFDQQNLKPWSPVDVEGEDVGLDYEFHWVRRDKLNGAGINSTPVTTNSEGIGSWEIDVYNAEAVGSEEAVIRTISHGSLTSATDIVYTYTDAQQTTDFGGQRVTPMIVAIYQMTAGGTRGFPNLTEIDRYDNYNPSGYNFSPALPSVVNRWSGANAQASGGGVGINVLEVSTTVDTEWGGVSFPETGPALNHEVYTVIELPVGGLDEIHGGVVLRGQGATQITLRGLMIGLGGTTNNVLGIKQFVAGSGSSGAGDYLGQAVFNWVPGTLYSLRARAYKNRIQAKVWAYGSLEPAAWNIDVYNSTSAPLIGFGGLFAYYTASVPRIHYYSWAHRGLRAA